MYDAGVRSRRSAMLCSALIAVFLLAADAGHGAPVQFGPQTVPDSDGDGLDDVLERVLNTQPHAADTDGDGWIDAVELARESDPLSAASVPQTATGQLSLGFWSRTAFLTGFVRTFSFIYLPSGYPAEGLQMELVVALPQGGLLHLDDSYLSGPDARTSIDFMPVPGNDTALVMIVGANLADSLIQSSGSMGGAAVAWHGADSAPQAADLNKDATDGLWIQLVQAGPIYFSRPVNLPGARGGRGAGAVYVPIEPSPPPQGEPGELCLQVTVPVAYENGVWITRVTAAHCDEGWDAHCDPTECGAAVGNEYETVDPVGLIGG